jgi:hypothetical protein
MVMQREIMPTRQQSSGGQAEPRVITTVPQLPRQGSPNADLTVTTTVNSLTPNVVQMLPSQITVDNGTLAATGVSVSKCIAFRIYSSL